MRNIKGFTLIELMIVVVIIGILSAIAIPKFSSIRDQANEATCRSNLRSLAGAEMMYYAKHSSFTDLHGLENSQCLMNASRLTCPGTDTVYDIVHDAVMYTVSCPGVEPFHGSMTDGLSSW